MPDPIGASIRRSSLDAALAYAWDAAAFTASQAMSATGLTRSTIIDVLDELVELDLIRELPNARSGDDYRMGRPARRFELRADGAVVVGIDAGRLHLTTAVADLRGSELARHHISLDEGHDSPQERRATVVRAVDEVLRLAGRHREELVAICIGVPAPVNADGVSPPHRDGFWRRMNPGFAEQFSEWVPLVRVENDASLAAVAEGAVGAAVGCQDYVTLLAGERLGAGIVLGGSLLRGAHGGAGEMVAFDHVKGVGGAFGLGFRAAQWAREAIESGEVVADSPLARVDPSTLDARVVLQAAREGDAVAGRIVDRLSAALGIVAGVFGSLFDPQLIVISGAISDGAADVVAAARRGLSNELDLPAPEIVTSKLGGDVVCIGSITAAVSLAREGILALARQTAMSERSMGA